MRPAIPILALTVAVLVPANALAAAPALAPAPEGPPEVAERALHVASGQQRALQDLAAALPVGGALGDQLLTAATLSTSALDVPAPGGDVGFAEALAALHRAAGVEAAPAGQAPPEALARAVAPVLAAAAGAATLTQEAFAPLSPEERAFLLERLPFLLAPAAHDEAEAADAARALELAGRVDMARVELGAALLGEAMDAFDPPELVFTQSWVDVTGMVEIGSTNDDVYTVPRVLLLDLGGNDYYDNRAASSYPGALPLPVSAVLDLGGNDVYSTSVPLATNPELTIGQAVGIGGIGLLADRWGDDLYQADAINSPHPCSPYDGFLGNVHRQMLYTQAVGVLGVGAIADLSGNDQYRANSINVLELPCHWGKAYVFAQAIGLHDGAGVLLDDTGDDLYWAYTEEGGKDDNLAHTHAQAASAGGVALLADKEGHDTYHAQAYAHAILSPAYRFKGGFAFVFAQASNLATRENPGGSGLTVAPGCVDLPAQFADPCLDFQASIDLCSLLGGGATGGENHGYCPKWGAAVLLDVLGNDSFAALPTSLEPDPCLWASWAVSSSQGSAAWGGVAALANLDIDGSDTFVAAPYAEGGGCSVLSVRAHSYGQGYGGPILWDFWDPPPAPPTLFAFLPYTGVSYGSVSAGPLHIPAIGILASGGLPEVACPTPRGPSPVGKLVPGVAQPRLCPLADSLLALATLPPDLTAAPDHYYSGPTAVNFQTRDGSADAQSWVQGAAGNLGTTFVNAFLFAGALAPYAYGTLEAGVGVGVHLDWAGDDLLQSIASANAGYPYALSTAQGAGASAIGAQVNVGGDDAYEMRAFQNGVDQPSQTRGQAWSEGTWTLLGPGTVCVLGCFATLGVGLPGIGVEVDLGGWDSYSEAADPPGPPCQLNGVTFGTWLGLFGTTWWGTLINTAPGCVQTPAPTGLAVGLDWLSEIVL